MNARILFLLVFPLFLFAACSDDDPVSVTPSDITDDEYAVWSAALDSMVVYEKDDYVVLQKGTESYALGDSAMSAYLKQQLKVTDAVIQNYVTRNSQAATIERKLTLPVDYMLLSASEIESILSQGGYDELYIRYPDCNGVTTLSRVGFSADRSSALVYLSHTTGYLAGAGWALLLRKVSGTWQIIAETIVWVS